MKKIILILAIATFISCSNDDIPTNNCYEILFKQKIDVRWFVNYKEVTKTFYDARTVGEIYCPPTSPSY
jgi:hypothetical protein